MRPLKGGFEAWLAAGYPVAPKAGQTPAAVAENLRQAEGDPDLPM